MKKILFAIALVAITHGAFSQTKVFKEVSQDVSSQIKPITQDNKLVGYLVFTELEQASEGIFNYKISLMDENLNDIGTVNFKEQKLLLQQVQFEQDVLCLAYVKSNYIGKVFKNSREFRKEKKQEADNAIFTQFLNLDGKVIATNSIKTKIAQDSYYSSSKLKIVGDGKLKHNLQLKNISGKGFVMFYGDDTNSQMVIYDLNGKQTVKKTIKDEAKNVYLLTSGSDVYMLLRNADTEAYTGYTMLAYRTTDSTTFPKYALKDKKGNALTVLTFDNDPITGKPYVSGNIVNGSNSSTSTAKELANDGFAGVFTIHFNGTKKADITECYSYWNDGSQSSFSKRGLIDDKAYARQSASFRDYSGNTYFVGSSVVKKTRWGAIAGAVITSPTLVGPIAFLGRGTQKSKIADATLIKQSDKGALTVDNSIKSEDSRYFPARYPFFMYDFRTYYTVSNPDTKTSYLLFDDNKNITIYNVTGKKVERTIPHWKGGIETSVFPAKEGYVMVAQYDSRERTRRISIESL